MMYKVFLAVTTAPLLDVVENTMTQVASNLTTFGNSHLSDLMGLGCGLAAILVVIAALRILAPVMMGQQAPDIMALIKIVAIAAILNAGTWSSVCSFLSAPGEALEDSAYQLYRGRMDKIWPMMAKCRDYRSKADEELSRQTAEAQKKAEEASKSTEAEKSTWDKIQEWAEHPIDNTVNAAKEWVVDTALEMVGSFFHMLTNYLLFILQAILVVVGEFIYLSAAVMVVMMGKIGMCVMGMFGPIAFALSLTSTWSNAWAQWIGKYVSLSLYSGILWIVLAFNSTIFEYCVTQDYMALERISDQGNWQMFATYFTNWFGTVAFFIVACVIGAQLAGHVPEFASWAIPNGTGSSATSGAAATGWRKATSTSEKVIPGTAVAGAVVTKKVVIAGAAAAMAGRDVAVRGKEKIKTAYEKAKEKMNNNANNPERPSTGQSTNTTSTNTTSTSQNQANRPSNGSR